MGLLKELYIDIPKKRPGIHDIIIQNLVNPTFRVMFYYRLAKHLNKSRLKLLRMYASRLRAKMITKRNCDISIHAEIGKNFRLAHPIGVVIGAGTIIKDNVTIFQQVTLGSHGKEGKEYPVIEEGVTIYAGAVLIGRITVGENATIGAQTLVNKDIPKDHIAYGNPLQIKPKS
jgi:serine O-acetyltransferase